MASNDYTDGPRYMSFGNIRKTVTICSLDKAYKQPYLTLRIPDLVSTSIPIDTKCELSGTFTASMQIWAEFVISYALCNKFQCNRIEQTIFFSNSQTLHGCFQLRRESLSQTTPYRAGSSLPSPKRKYELLAHKNTNGLTTKTLPVSPTSKLKSLLKCNL